MPEQRLHAHEIMPHQARAMTPFEHSIGIPSTTKLKCAMVDSRHLVQSVCLSTKYTLPARRARSARENLAAETIFMDLVIFWMFVTETKRILTANQNGAVAYDALPFETACQRESFQHRA